jgi:hypothetical protein
LHSFGLLVAARIDKRPELAEQAVILFGTQQKLFRWLPIILSPAERSEFELALAKVRKTVGEEVFAAAWAKGQSMTRQQVFAYALAEIKGNT